MKVKEESSKEIESMVVIRVVIIVSPFGIVGVVECLRRYVGLVGEDASILREPLPKHA